MSDTFSNPILSRCWICVLQSDNTDKLQIVYTLNLSKYTEKQGQPYRVIYCRKFEDLLDGIGHKLFLEELSNLSLKRYIAAYNE